MSLVSLEALARGMVELYEAAEQAIVAAAAARFRGSLPDELRPWEAQRLGEIRRLRVALEEQIGTLTREGAAEMRRTIDRALSAGRSQAARDVAQITEPLTPQALRPVELAAEALTREALGKVQATHRAILRTVLDDYRAIVAETVRPTVAVVTSQRDALQRALNRFADKGITGFVDSRGRRWDLVSYTDMATRTAVGRAQVEGYLDHTAEQGLGLVFVVPLPERCGICAPWEGKVLRRDASVDGTQPTVDDARSAGVWHANCRHALSAWVPGLPTYRPDKEARQEADRRYEERLTQRALERRLRESKRRVAVALDDQAAAKARARLRAAQAEMNRFIEDTGRVRLRWREAPRKTG